MGDTYISITTNENDEETTTTKHYTQDGVTWGELLEVFYNHLKTAGYCFSDEVDGKFNELIEMKKPY